MVYFALVTILVGMDWYNSLKSILSILMIFIYVICICFVGNNCHMRTGAKYDGHPLCALNDVKNDYSSLHLREGISVLQGCLGQGWKYPHGTSALG